MIWLIRERNIHTGIIPRQAYVSWYTGAANDVFWNPEAVNPWQEKAEAEEANGEDEF